MTELPVNSTTTIYCSGHGTEATHAVTHHFWMYGGPALEQGFSEVRVWAHYFCSHECVEIWEAGNGARPYERN